MDKQIRNEPTWEKNDLQGFNLWLFSLLINQLIIFLIDFRSLQFPKAQGHVFQNPKILNYNDIKQIKVVNHHNWEARMLECLTFLLEKYINIGYQNNKGNCNLLAIDVK